MDVAQDQVGGLPAHPRQGQEFLHGAGHLAVVLLQQHPGGKDNVPGLGPEKAAGVNVGFKVLRLRRGQSLQGRELGKEGRGHLVDPLVGALGGETGGKEKFIILLVLQGADAVWVKLFQRLDDGADVLGCFHKAVESFFSILAG